MASAEIDILIKTETLGDVEAKLQSLNEQIKEVGINSKEFKKLSGEIQKVQATSDKANKAIKGIDYGALAGEVAKVSAGLGAAGVAISSFAGGNEELQETLAKTNAVLALAATGEAIYTATKKDGEIATLATTAAETARATATKAAAVAQAAYATVVGTSTGALKLFRLALVSTGIGAIIVGIGLLVANWDKLTEIVEDNSEKIKEFGGYMLYLLGPIGLLIKGLDLLADKVGGWANIWPAITGAIEAFFVSFSDIMGKVKDLIIGIFTLDLDLIAKSVSDAGELLADGARENVKLAEAARKEEQAKADRVANQEVLDLETKKLEAIQASEEEIFNARKNSLENQLQIFRDNNETETKEYKEKEIELLKLETDYNKKRQDELEKAAKDRKAVEDKAREERKKAREEEERDYKAAVKENADFTKDSATTTADKLIEISQNEEIEQARIITESGKNQATIDLELQNNKIKYARERFKIIKDEQAAEIELINTKLEGKLKELELQALIEGNDPSEIRAQIAAAELDAKNKLLKVEEQRAERLKEFETSTGLIKKEYDALNTTLGDTSTEFEKVITKQVELSEKQADDNATQTAIDNIIKLADITIAEAERSIAFLEANEENYQEGRLELNEETANKIKAIELTILKSRRDAIEKLLGVEGLSQEERLKLEKEYQEISGELWKNGLDEKEIQFNNWTELITEKFGKEAGDWAQVAGQAFDGLNDIIALNRANLDKLGQKYDEEALRIETYYTNLAEAAGANADEVIAINTRKDKELLALEKKRAVAERDLIVKNANIQFALDLGAIVSKGALAVVNALASLTFPANLVSAAITASLVGVQIATATKAKNTAIAAANAGVAYSGGGGGSENGVRTLADGGYVSGPGTGTSDSIPARLSNGEFVVNAAATAQNLPLLERINNAPKRFANGGLAMQTQPNSSFNTERLEGVLDRIEKRLGVAPKAYVVPSEIKQGLDSDAYLKRRAELTT